MVHEAQVQDELRDLIKEAIKEHKFHGIELTDVRREYSVKGRKVDLVILMQGDAPFMFIETKRKVGSGSLFDATSTLAIGQVMSYAVLWNRSHPEQRVPFVATADPKYIVVFRVPENIEEYVDQDYLNAGDYRNVIKNKYGYILEKQIIIRERLSLTKEYIQQLLERLAKEYAGIERIAGPALAEVMIEKFRRFVDILADNCAPLLERRLERDGEFRKEVEELGYKTDSESPQNIARNLARMMAYVFMNKLVFYKVLEKSYKELAPLRALDSPDSVSASKFKEYLEQYFKKAVESTGDFEPIFITRIYDKIPIPDNPEIIAYINDFINDLEALDINKIGDEIGYIYEELIPIEERHQLGQFYTPKWVCELITHWAIKNGDDRILDPGVGSGGFLLEAYERLREIKVGVTQGKAQPVSTKVHEKILSQLYAIDINPFAAHLSAMGVSLKNIRAPSTTITILMNDFFAIQPGQATLTPYEVMTPSGKVPRMVVMQNLDAVIGNPPYTRWAEIPEKTQDLIRQYLEKQMKEYKLIPQVFRGLQPGIYVYWIMHATNFLKNGGRLGMIISNTWLQSSYGIRFGNFLLDHYRIKAVIDITLRLFKDAMITTCILLAERETDKTRRLDNDVAFVHIPGEVERVDVEELLNVLKTGKSDKYTVIVVKQKEIPRDEKWITMFSRVAHILRHISSHPLITKLGEFFEPSGGNTVYSVMISAKTGQVRGPGASEFHYLTPSDVKIYKLDKWSYPNVPLRDAIVYPAITDARQAIYFTFTKEDWERMYESNDRCYMFVCHLPREKLPKEVADYTKLGEVGFKTRVRETRKGGKPASETEGARIRSREKNRFYGWYDLGGVIPAPIFAIYQARYKTRFVWCKFPVAMYHALIALIPKEKVSLNEVHIKALLAYLNSSFAQLYIETKGRVVPGGGPIGLEIGVARDMPVLDVRKLSNEQLGLLTRLFDELEGKARMIGGASARDQLENLKPKIYEIDRTIATILGIKEEDVRVVQREVDSMVERRVSVAKRSYV